MKRGLCPGNPESRDPKRTFFRGDGTPEGRNRPAYRILVAGESGIGPTDETIRIGDTVNVARY
jgi:hypothetical protein